MISPNCLHHMAYSRSPLANPVKPLEINFEKNAVFFKKEFSKLRIGFFYFFTIFLRLTL